MTQLIELALGQAPAPEFLAACQQATAGNPFLLRELLGELAAAGVDATAANAALVAQLSAQRRRPRGARAPASASTRLSGARPRSQRARRRLRADDRGRAGGAGRARRCAGGRRAGCRLDPGAGATADLRPPAGARQRVRRARRRRALRLARPGGPGARRGSRRRRPDCRPPARLRPTRRRGQRRDPSRRRGKRRRRGANDVAATYLRRALESRRSPGSSRSSCVSWARPSCRRARSSRRSSTYGALAGHRRAAARSVALELATD